MQKASVLPNQPQQDAVRVLITVTLDWEILLVMYFLIPFTLFLADLENSFFLLAFVVFSLARQD